MFEAASARQENANKNGDMATEGISAKPLPAPSGDTLIALQPTVEVAWFKLNEVAQVVFKCGLWRVHTSRATLIHVFFEAFIACVHC